MQTKRASHIIHITVVVVILILVLRRRYRLLHVQDPFNMCNSHTSITKTWNLLTKMSLTVDFLEPLDVWNTLEIFVMLMHTECLPDIFHRTKNNVDLIRPVKVTDCDKLYFFKQELCLIHGIFVTTNCRGIHYHAYVMNLLSDAGHCYAMSCYRTWAVRRIQ